MRTIVLDTNCLIVILPSKSPFHNVWNELLTGNIRLCVTTEILNEYEEILHQRIPSEIAENAIQTILNFPELKQVDPTYFWKLIKDDPDDNKFVDCAICGEAELIVTNDKHFNILNDIDFPKVIIQRIEDFSESL
ncbi:MAG: putative toxin-antitoxin system toxin component, PIN family [Prevotellaceae bacterium]|nr:putative toxin-antitoxin system toxin component, PIN family [Candidatus Colivivens equi]